MTLVTEIDEFYSTNISFYVLDLLSGFHLH